MEAQLTLTLFVGVITVLTLCNCDTIHVDTSSAVADTTDAYIGIGWEMFSFLEDVDKLGDENFRYLARQLSPGVLRVGGITADWVFYNLTKTKSESKNVVINKRNRVGGFWPEEEKNLPIAQFEQLVAFVKSTEMSLLFDLNELHGRNCHYQNTTHCVGEWDTSNLRSFLQYIKDNDVGPIYGFELGNELTRSNHIDIETNIADHLTLVKIVESIWAEGSRPPVFGPSTDICNSDVEKFLNATKEKLTGFTYHSYPGRDGSESYKQLIDIEWLRESILQNDLHASSIECIKLWRKIGKPAGMKLWLTETNSAYTGTYGVMNAFENGFWYIASLGQYGVTGVTDHSRWSLIGGAFGIIDLHTHPYTVAPDYFTAILYKRLMGSKILDVKSDANAPFLTYAACGKIKGSVVVMYANPSANDVTVDVAGVELLPRQDYFLTAKSMNSTTMMLNGTPLVLTAQNTLPALKPRVETKGPWILPGRSYGFTQFNTKSPLCN